jgi:hypothetical protein
MLTRFGLDWKGFPGCESCATVRTIGNNSRTPAPAA